LTPPPTPDLRQPLGDGPAQKFVDFFNSAVPEFHKMPLPPVSALPASKVLAIPPQDTDDVYLRPGQAAFLTSNQCQGCHDTSAQLSIQTPGTPRQWAPPGTSFQYSVQGPGSPPKGGNTFNISQYGEWSVSIMALASRDPAFLSQVETERVLHKHVEPSSIDNFCYRCHGPMGQRQFHIDNGGDPTQVPPGTPLKPQPNFNHFMTYSTPESCRTYSGFPCNQPTAQPPFAKYGGLARDGISCTMCHHLGPQDGKPPADPWSVFYGFRNPAVAGLENRGCRSVCRVDALQPHQVRSAGAGPAQSYLGAARLTPPSSTPAVAGIWGHTQNFNATTVTRDFMPRASSAGLPRGDRAGDPAEYPKIRNGYQIRRTGRSRRRTYPGTKNKPCPPVKPLPNGLFDPRSIRVRHVRTDDVLRWAASASFGGASPRTSCTFCHMPNAEPDDGDRQHQRSGATAPPGRRRTAGFQAAIRADIRWPSPRTRATRAID
jgi:hypothetical protein